MLLANALRAADGLATLPGVSLSGDPLAPGGDAYLSIRGLRPGVGQALLDGHPVGPIGAVAGTYGLFSGVPIAQTGLRGTDLTSATLRAATYRVSGDDLLRNDLAKLVVSIDPRMSLTLTTHDAAS